jgi:hypothetical protein
MPRFPRLKLSAGFPTGWTKLAFLFLFVICAGLHFVRQHGVNAGETRRFQYKQSESSASELADLKVAAIYDPAALARQTQQMWEQWKKEHKRQ